MTNARFEDLEKRVKKIKLKKYTKLGFILVAVISLSSYVLIQNITNEKIVKKPTKVKVIIKENKVEQFELIKKVEKIVKVVKNEPVYDTIKLKLNLPSSNEEIKVNEVITEKKKIIKKEVIKKKNIDFKVKEVKSEDALLKRFKVAGDFESASSLANLYFKKKRFERSIYWSKKASKLDAKEASSWIIYAKSKYELGNKQDAIKSLELYLDYFSSDEIRKLLDFYRSHK